MKKSNTFFIIILIVFDCCFSHIFAQGEKRDSSFWDVSLPELQSYKVYYMKKLENLQNEKRILIERGIEDGERILQKSLDREVMDDVLIRLADLYYFKEKDDYLDKMDEYSKEFEESMQDSSFQVPQEPSLEFPHTFDLYQRIIDEFPESDKVDDAIYNIGFLYEDKGNPDRAHQYYLHLINKYPESDYVTEAHMRLGEYFFNPPRNDIKEAIKYYKRVLKERQSSHYNEALYKLGWSYYRLSKYPEAISFFTNLVESIKKSKDLKSHRETRSVDLYDEALEYIAVCFMDFGELDEILHYLDKINNPSWGEQILSEFGDIYFNKREEFRQAIQIYNALIDYNPFSPQAPVIQKKIVNCYIALDDERQTYLNRKKLFELYNIESAWWDKVEDVDAIENAYSLTEEALKNNINYLLQKAEEKENRKLYESVVTLGNKYLETFSEHVNAYMIRWNIALILDTKLHAYEDALQEYMTISMAYDAPRYKSYARKKGLGSIKDAAKNAVVVADSLVQREKREGTAIDFTDSVYVSEIPLSQAEELLIMACDNYIKLFPFDANTPTVLANVGALFYLHKKYNKAIKYYRTLTKYFPDSDQIYVVQLSIAKSYIGKEDFKSAEALAKRLLKYKLPKDIKNKVRELYGQSIFLKAQQLVKSGKNSEAAAEYFRMAMEVPLLDFADRALFNSAREYEKIGNLEYAIRSYNQLILSYRSSKLYIDALNNLAYDYAEVEEYGKSAEKYEELTEVLSDSAESQNAFFNAHIYYVKSENWNKAIETAERWIIQYPEAHKTPDINFKLADYYYKVDNYEKALHTYQKYPAMYPESSLCVDAYYRLGEMFSEKNLAREAETAYYRAHIKNKDLKAADYDTHDYYAAEGLFKASRLMHDRYEKVTTGISGFGYNSSMRKKRALLDSLLFRYQEVVKYKSKRLPESLFRIGQIYEQFTRALKGQQLPDTMPVDKKAVRRNEVLFQCENTYLQAYNKYSKALPVLRKIESQKSVRSEEKLEKNDQDSTQWLSKIENKVSEMLYHKADVNKEAAENLLTVPVPSELEGLEKLEYQKQLLLTTIRPLVEKAIKSHKKNIFLSDSLHLNNTWIDSSRNKILDLSDILPKRFIHLSYQGLSEFGKAAHQFQRSYLINKKQPAIDNINNLVNLIESSELYANLVVELYLKSMQYMNSFDLISYNTLPIQNRLINFSLGISDTIDTYINEAEKNKQQADQLFNNTNDFIYESCLTAFEDHIYFLEKFERNLLENIYQSLVNKKDKSDNLYKLAIKLIKLDPEIYSKKLDISLIRITCTPDTTWKVSHVFYKGWQQPDFSAQEWIYFTNDTTDRRSTSGTPFENSDLVHYHSYLRKVVHIPGYPVYGQIRLKRQNILEVYINGEQIKGEHKSGSQIFTSHLKQNKNVIALKVLKNIHFRLEDFVEISYIRKEDL
ncbi:MAG: tetratricopeptide repeat protein [bacterium]